MSRMIDLIRASAVPSNLMQSAAKGSLSVPPREMIEILVYLAVHNKVFGRAGAAHARRLGRGGIAGRGQRPDDTQRSSGLSDFPGQSTAGAAACSAGKSVRVHRLATCAGAERRPRSHRGDVEERTSCRLVRHSARSPVESKPHRNSGRGDTEPDPARRAGTEPTAERKRNGTGAGGRT